MSTASVKQGKSYTLNGVTDITVVGEDDPYLVEEISGEPPLIARILMQDIIDGKSAGSIVELKTEVD